MKNFYLNSDFIIVAYHGADEMPRAYLKPEIREWCEYNMRGKWEFCSFVISKNDVHLYPLIKFKDIDLYGPLVFSSDTDATLFKLFWM
jgi:hypothetical protein